MHCANLIHNISLYEYIQYKFSKIKCLINRYLHKTFMNIKIVAVTRRRADVKRLN